MLTHCCASLVGPQAQQCINTCTLLNCQSTRQPQYHHGDHGLARPEGLEPPLAVLETAVLPIELCPLVFLSTSYIYALFSFVL